MASGKLGAEDLAAGTTTTVYTVPADNYSVVSVSFVNRGTNPTTLRLSLSDTDTPTNAEYLEWETELLPKNILERTGLVLSAGQKIVVRSSQPNVNCVAFGMETSTT